MGELKPCPFCGHTESTVRSVWKYWAVGCNNCAMGGPVRDTPEEAEDAWNERCERTCQIDDMKSDVAGEASYDHTEHIYWCDSCHDSFSLIKYNEGGDTWCELPKFCPNCGAKVVD